MDGQAAEVQQRFLDLWKIRRAQPKGEKRRGEREVTDRKAYSLLFIKKAYAYILFQSYVCRITLSTLRIISKLFPAINQNQPPAATGSRRARAASPMSAWGLCCQTPL